jgi:flagellar hook-length control protein FliK
VEKAKAFIPVNEMKKDVVMIMASGSAANFLGTAKNETFGTALNASEGPRKASLFSMILAGMKTKNPTVAGNKSGGFLYRGEDTSGSGSRTGNNLGDPAGDPAVAAALESVFAAQGTSLDKIVLEQGDFAFLGALMRKLGVSQARIEKFFNEIMETRKDGGITLANFLKDLTAFEQNEKLGIDVPGSSLSGGSLDKSAIPHLELILRNLGVSAQRADVILANAARENGTLDINKLVSALKQYAWAVEKNAAEQSNQTAGNLPAGKQAERNQAPVPSAQKAVAGLFNSGLSVLNKDADTPFSLKAFIAALEEKNQGPARAIKAAAVNTAVLTENQMPAMRSMEMEKINSFFGFAREMMNQSRQDSADHLLKNKMAGAQNHEKQKGIQQSLSRSASFLNTPGTDRSGAIQPPVDNLIKQMEKGLKPLNDAVLRPGSFHDGMVGMERFQTTNSQPGQMDASAGIKRNAGTWQNTHVPQSVVNQVGKEIAAFLHRGDRFFTLQLKPPELGMVKIEMDVKENLLKMSIVTETGSAKDMLQANYADLRRVLEGYGVKVESFDIQLGNSLNQSAANGDSPLNQQNHHSGRFGKHLNNTGQAGDNDSEPPPAPQLRRDGLVDLLA